MASTHQPEVMEKIVALCKRRGFIFPSSEIYGGIGGFWDYGPLGSQLKKNIKDAWWHDMVEHPPTGPDGKELSMVGVDCSIIMNSRTWEASGHVGGFADLMSSCKYCKKMARSDQVWSMIEETDWFKSLVELYAAKGIDQVSGVDLVQWAQKKAKKLAPNLAIVRNPTVTISWLTERVQRASEPFAMKLKDVISYLATEQLGTTQAFVTPCPFCGGDLTEPRAFNLMFKTFVGAVEDSSSAAYLRPETAQGIFVNYKNVLDSTRVKIPFGIGQMGKAFRNEINPRNFTFRSREFEQMEIEFFCHPNSSRMWYEFWRDARIRWYTSLGIKSDKLRPREQGPEELAHYSVGCTDIEYLFPFSGKPEELEGVAHRGCFDLSQHGKFAKGDENAFAYFDDETKERYVPHVIEPSAGADRFTLAIICEAYTHDPERASPEFMKFHPRLAPIKAAVFPLVAKDGLPEIAEPIFREIRQHYAAQYDAKQSIGKRYARMDEAGTPFCFTIDGQTKEDGTVTVRDRDTAGQIRIPKEGCLQYLREHLRVE